VHAVVVREGIDEGIVIAVCHVVEVLDADYVRDPLSLRELGSDVAQDEMRNPSLTLQFDKHSQRFLDGPFRGLRESTDPKVDDLEPINTEITLVDLMSMP
jgi:hypothetical protein